MNDRWQNKPEGSTWGNWGKNDQLGRMNLVTSELRVQAAEEIQEGLCFCLSMPLNLPGGNSVNPKRFPPKFGAVFHPPGSEHPYYNMDWNALQAGNMDVTSDECITLYSQYSTQWDSFAHVGSRFDADGDGEAEMVYYNGFKPGEHIKGPYDSGGMGARALGVENMARGGMQGRGVLVDLQRHFGNERVSVNYEMLMAIFEKDGVVIEEGDFFLFHTGWDTMILSMNGRPDANKLHSSGAVLDGFDEKILKWITESGIVAVISDNMAIEDSLGYGNTHGGCSRLPLHRHCLFRLGVHLGELWYLSELAHALRERNRSRFFLTAPPLRIPGAVGSPTTPIATI